MIVIILFISCISLISASEFYCDGYPFAVTEVQPLYNSTNYLIHCTNGTFDYTAFVTMTDLNKIDNGVITLYSCDQIHFSISPIYVDTTLDYNKYIGVGCVIICSCFVLCAAFCDSMAQLPTPPNCSKSVNTDNVQKLPETDIEMQTYSHIKEPQPVDLSKKLYPNN